MAPKHDTDLVHRMLAGALVACAALVGAAVAWTVLDVTPPDPGIQGGLRGQSLSIPAGLEAAPVIDEPSPTPAPPEPDPPTTTPEQVPQPSNTSAPFPNPAPETESGPPPGFEADVEEGRRRHCTTPGWPCRSYTWTFKGGHNWLVLEMDPALYDTYRTEEKPTRLRPSERGLALEPAYDIHVSDPRDDRFVGHVARELRRMASEQGFNGTQELSFVLAFVQGLRYTSDSVTTGFDEYPRYPLETLIDEGGDCEDTSILYASIVQALGHQAILLSPPGHMAVGVAGTLGQGADIVVGSTHYLYAETTGDGWPIGVIPPEMGREMKSWSLVPTPLLSLGGASVTPQGSNLRIGTTVTNIGSMSADAVVTASLIAGNGTVYAAPTCPIISLGSRQSSFCDLLVDALPVPEGVAVRLEVRLTGGGETYDLLASSPFIPWPASP